MTLAPSSWMAVACLFLSSPARTSGPPQTMPLAREPEIPVSTFARTGSESSCDRALRLLDEIAPDTPSGARNTAHSALLMAMDETPTCATRVTMRISDLLCSDPRYGIAFSAAVVTASYPSRAVHAEVLRTERALRNNDESCLKATLPALQFVPAPSPEVVNATLRLATDHPSENAFIGAWLAVGSMAKAAKDDGTNSRDQITKALSAALARSHGSQRELLLEAAGNAACESCRHEIAKAATSSAPFTRRTAIAALRFFPDGARALCTALRADASSMVREYAAWALSFDAHEAEERRVPCLREAATQDVDVEVRKAAVRTLATLAEKNEGAASALSRLVEHDVLSEGPPEARSWVGDTELAKK